MERWLYSVNSVSNALMEHKSLHGRIMLENIPSAENHLDTIMTAMKNNHRLRIISHDYCENKDSLLIVEPYLLRLWHQRWYIVANTVNTNEVRRYCLDRIVDMQVMDEVFTMPDELTWQTVKLKHRIGLMNLLDWNHMFRGADGYIPTIIENETLDTDEWIELVETVKDLNVEDEVLNDSFYDKLDDDLKSEISGFSDQGECDEEFKKVESLKKLLPDWKWYDVYGEIDDAEKRIKEEEDEADYDDDYEQWRSQSEKEDAQIDEMFGALRWN